MIKIDNKGPFFTPNKSANSQISEQYESYKTSLRSKEKIELNIYKLSFENVGSADWDNDNNENKIDE